MSIPGIVGLLAGLVAAGLPGPAAPLPPHADAVAGCGRCAEPLTVGSTIGPLDVLRERPCRQTRGPAAGKTPKEPAADEGWAAGVKLVNDQQIQVLRRKELKLAQPEDVRVKFNNEVIQRFWDRMKATNKTVADREQAAFLKLPPSQQAQFIIRQVEFFGLDRSYLDDVDITTDPLVFDAYVKSVWPILRTTCAAAKCHGGAASARFALINDDKMTVGKHYTNFMILHEYAKEQPDRVYRLVDRDRPEESLLLIFGQPVQPGQLVTHPAKLSPFWKTATDQRYRTIQTWIQQLAVPAPDYGFKLERRQTANP